MAKVPKGKTAEQYKDDPIKALKDDAKGGKFGKVKWKIENGGYYFADYREKPAPDQNAFVWDFFPNGSKEKLKTSFPNAIFEPTLDEPPAQGAPGGNTSNQGAAALATLPLESEVPTDPRLIFIADYEGKSVVYSYTSSDNLTSPLLDGWTVKGADGKLTGGGDEAYTLEKAKTDFREITGTPSLMNNNAYINFAAGKGKDGIQFLIERENQPRFYDVGAGFLKGEDSPKGELTVQSLIEWSQRDKNYKFPYRYQDFVFLKWWKKVPLNYMITLRRYKYPTIDSVGSAEEHLNQVNPKTLTPAATAITFLGEDPGNKISTILGGIEAGLKWKDIKADVWEVSYQGSQKSADTPFPFASKVLGFLQGGGESAKTNESAGVPPDPYSNGPYENKILGPTTVIDTTKARDRGIEFKHEITLIFEYSARSIGSINSKAAMLDIIGNLMVLTFNEASFWGGMNRHMPMAAPSHEPWLGGPAGRKAWLNADPEGFFNAIGDQLAKAAENIGEAFQKFFDDPIAGLKSIAAGGMAEYMKMKTSGGKGFMQGIHSLLTGAPVGEWHLTVGNPMNPMMMIGNLICTGIKLEFNDELGPDDFPTELKATVQLQHGMPRDRAGIESMFNSGKGRLYSLPKGFEKTFASYNMSAVDSATGRGPGVVTAWPDEKSKKKGNGSPGSSGATTGNKQANSTERSNGGSQPRARKNPFLGDPAVVGNVTGYFAQSVLPRIANSAAATANAGVKFFKKITGQ